MTLLEHIQNRLAALGVTVRFENESLWIMVRGEERRIRPDPDWDDGFAAYSRARTRKFDTEDLSFTLNHSIEFPLVKLGNDMYTDSDDVLTDDRGNSVNISRASIPYSFGHFDSDAYEVFFQGVVLDRLERSSARFGRPVSSLFRRPITATYTSRGRKIPANLKSIAAEKIEACLVKLAIEQRCCYELSRSSKRKAIAFLGEVEGDQSIPTVSYEKNVVSYYKVARSSPFPSQSFLAFYNVLEYYFLKVAEDSLHHQLRALVNKPSFKSNIDGLDKVISLVRKQANQDNEVEMLRKVLQRFVLESDFIGYVNDIEATCGEKIYTKRRHIFGEQMMISLSDGHALSNAANVLKHIRNAIVHSSDRYKREECHIPLSDSEHTVAEFIPLVRFFAEQVIFGTASPQHH